MATQQVPLKCTFCGQLLRNRIVNPKSGLPRCSKCGGEIDLDAIDKAGDTLIGK